MPRTAETIHDELLVLRCQTGDESALGELVERWQPMLRARAARLLGDPDGAADVVQETWLAIVRGLGRLQDPAMFPAWSSRIVAHKVADRIRSRQADRAVDSLAGAREVADSRQPNDDGRRVRAAIGQLGEAHRAVAALHYLADLGIAEIAVTLDIPEGTVKSRLHTARERLRAALERS